MQERPEQNDRNLAVDGQIDEHAQKKPALALFDPKLAANPVARPKHDGRRAFAKAVLIFVLIHLA